MDTSAAQSVEFLGAVLSINLDVTIPVNKLAWFMFTWFPIKHSFPLFRELFYFYQIVFLSSSGWLYCNTHLGSTTKIVISVRFYSALLFMTSFLNNFQRILLPDICLFLHDSFYVNCVSSNQVPCFSSWFVCSRQLLSFLLFFFLYI